MQLVGINTKYQSLPNNRFLMPLLNRGLDQDVTKHIITVGQTPDQCTGANAEWENNIEQSVAPGKLAPRRNSLRS